MANINLKRIQDPTIRKLRKPEDTKRKPAKLVHLQKSKRLFFHLPTVAKLVHPVHLNTVCNILWPIEVI